MQSLKPSLTGEYFPESKKYVLSLEVSTPEGKSFRIKKEGLYFGKTRNQILQKFNRWGNRQYHLDIPDKWPIDNLNWSFMKEHKPKSLLEQQSLWGRLSPSKWRYGKQTKSIHVGNKLYAVHPNEVQRKEIRLPRYACVNGISSERNIHDYGMYRKIQDVPVSHFRKKK